MSKQSNNILVIDETSESNVSYKKSKVDSGYGRPLDIDILADMYYEDHDCILGIDTGSCITVINDHGIETSLHKYEKGTGIKFFKLTDKNLRENKCEIFIDINTLHDEWITKCQWSGYLRKYIEGDGLDYADLMNADIDGYALCMKVLAPYEIYDINDYDMPQAIEFCDKELNISFNGKDKKYKGYLPSVYQMSLICKCIDMLNYFIKYSGYDFKGRYVDTVSYHNYMANEFWTVNEYSNIYAYTVCPQPVYDLQRDAANKKPNIIMARTLKCESYKVFPIYKEISEAAEITE